MTAVVHIAGPTIQIGDQLRQRCSWCGAVLCDYDLTRVMVPASQPGPPSTWPTGAMVLVDGPMSTTVDHALTQPLPEGSCGRLDPDVTR